MTKSSEARAEHQSSSTQPKTSLRRPMMMNTVPELANDKDERIHKELCVLLEAAAIQQAQSSANRRWSEASGLQGSSTCGTPGSLQAASQQPSQRRGIVAGGKHHANLGHEVPLAHSHLNKNYDIQDTLNAR
ncbi:unnamed protein product [Urochloa humidicola]